MWVGDTVYFVSDRNGPFTLFAYDVKAAAVRELVHNPDGFDIRYASAGPGAHRLRAARRAPPLRHRLGARRSSCPSRSRRTCRRCAPTSSTSRPTRSCTSPCRRRASACSSRRTARSCRLPAEKGDVRNLTRSPGVADRDPAWSPGRQVDRVALGRRRASTRCTSARPTASAQRRRSTSATPGSFFYSPRWSPDSKKIVLWRQASNLWLVDVDHPHAGEDRHRPLRRRLRSTPSWSPDSRWIAYEKQLANHLHAIFIYSLDDKTIHQITDGRSDAYCAALRPERQVPVVPREHRRRARGERRTMTSMGQPVTSSVYGGGAQEGARLARGPRERRGGRATPGRRGGQGRAREGQGREGGQGEKERQGRRRSPSRVKIDFDGHRPAHRRAAHRPRELRRPRGRAPRACSSSLSAPIAFADEDYLEFRRRRARRRSTCRASTSRSARPRSSSRRSTGRGRACDVRRLGATARRSSTRRTRSGSSPAPTRRRRTATASLKSVGDMRGVGRPARRVAADLPRGLAHRARLPLRPARPRARSRRRRRSSTRRSLDGIASRDDLNALLEEALGNLVLGHVWAFGGALPAAGPRERGPARRGLRASRTGATASRRSSPGENWNPKLRAPLTAAGRRREGGRFPPRRERPGAARATDDVNRLFLGPRRQADGASRWDRSRA